MHYALSLMLHNRKGHLNHATTDTSSDGLPRSNRADALGGTGENNVPGLQRKYPADEADKVGDREDHVPGVPILLHLPVHLQPQPGVT